MQNIDRVAADLLPHYGADCPAAVVARASWPDEEVLRCDLGELAARVRERGIRRTAIIVVGRVLRDGSFRDSHLYSADRESEDPGEGRARSEEESPSSASGRATLSTSPCRPSTR